MNKTDKDLNNLLFNQPKDKLELKVTAAVGPIIFIGIFLFLDLPTHMLFQCALESMFISGVIYYSFTRKFPWDGYYIANQYLIGFMAFFIGDTVGRFYLGDSIEKSPELGFLMLTLCIVISLITFIYLFESIVKFVERNN